MNVIHGFDSREALIENLKAQRRENLILSRFQFQLGKLDECEKTRRRISFLEESIKLYDTEQE